MQTATIEEVVVLTDSWPMLLLGTGTQCCYCMFILTNSQKSLWWILKVR